ncbi:MAG: hypothetical protein ACW963_00400 [Candidatus Sifarchaeia archaeon]|jgi:hypothetical protein
MSIEENVAVIELPYTESVSCYLERKGKYLWSFTFVKDGATVLFKGNILNPDQDKLIESITDNMASYFSSYGISGLHAAVSKILDVIENPSNYTWQNKEDIDILHKLPEDVAEIKEEKEVPLTDIRETKETKETLVEVEEIKETEKPLSEAIKTPISKISEEKPELLVKEIAVEGGKTTLQIHARNPNEWRIVAIHGRSASPSAINISSTVIDDVADKLNEQLEFFSFSGAYDAAEKLVDVLNNIEDYFPKEEVSVSIGDEASVDEMPSLEETVKKLRTAEDVDRYIELMKDSVKDEERMAFLKDIRIAHVEDVTGHIYRRGADNWLLSFSSTNTGESLSKTLQINELNDEDVARVLNQGIPQISLSAALLAAEKVLQVIQELRQRPQEELVINQAVEHFLGVVQEHKDIEKATELSIELLKKFGELENSLGVIKFGSNAISLLDMREKYSDANRLRMDIADQLLELDVDLFIEFADESINKLTERGQLLDASKLCSLLVDTLTKRYSEYRVDLRVIVQYMKKTVEVLQKADLMRTLAENSVEYGEFLLNNFDQLGEEDHELNKLVKEEIVEFFTSALNFFETLEDRFDLLETTEKILNLLSETDKLEEEAVLFSQRGFKYFSEEGKDDLVLELASTLSKKLMKEEEKKYLKALEFVNAVIKIFIERKEFEKIIKFGFETIDDLIRINQKSEAREYLMTFTDFAIQAYENDFNQTAEITLSSAAKMKEIGESKEVIDRLFTLIEYTEDIDEALKIYNEKALPMLCAEGDFHLATEFVDQVSEYISQLGGPNAPRRVAEFNFSFAKAILKTDSYSLALEYLEKAYESYEAAGDTYTAIKVYLDTYEIFVNSKSEEGFKVISYIADYYQEKRLLRLLIPILENVIEILVKNEVYASCLEYITQVSTLYEEMADIDSAYNILVKYRDILQDKDFNLSKKLTEQLLNRSINVDHDYNAGIEILKPLVEFLIQQKNYETAFEHITQLREYFDIVKGIGKGTVLFTQYKDQIVAAGDIGWAEKLVELIVEMNLSEHRETIAAIISQEFSEQLFQLNQYTRGVKHATAAAQYFFRSEKHDDAINFLQELVESFETNDQIKITDKAEIIKTLAELKAKTDEWTNGAALCIRFVKQLLDKETQNIELANTMMLTAIEITKARDPTKTIDIAQKYIDKLDTMGRYQESVQFSLEIIKIHYLIKNPDTAEEYAKQAIQKLLKTEGVGGTQQFVKTLVSEVKDLKTLENLLLNLSEEFTSAEFIEAARAVFEEVLQTLQVENRARISAKLYEKFSYLVQEFSQDLMVEYAYKAADHFRSYEDFIGMTRVFENLSDQLAFEDFDRSVKVLKRCIFILKQLNANFPLQNLILHLDEREITLRAMELGLDVKQLLEID